VESHITIRILSRKSPPSGVFAKLRWDNGYELLGSCVRKKVGDLVGDLSVPERRTSSSSLL
jgi:hypothetical protein